MYDKSARNELLITLQDVKELIGRLEHKSKYEINTKEEAAEVLAQLLSAYSLKVQILESLNNT